MKIKRAVFSGSFDPVTLGHADIIKRAATVFDEVMVAICCNTEKRGGMFSPEERLEFVDSVISELGLTNVKAEICGGLLSDFAKERGIEIIVRGARGGSEFEAEAELAKINGELGELETLIFPAKPELAHQSSTFARDMILYGRSELALPESVRGILLKKGILSKKGVFEKK